MPDRHVHKTLIIGTESVRRNRRHEEPPYFSNNVIHSDTMNEKKCCYLPVSVYVVPDVPST